MPDPSEKVVASRVSANRSEFIRKVVNDYMTQRKKPRETERKEKPSDLIVKDEAKPTR